MARHPLGHREPLAQQPPRRPERRPCVRPRARRTAARSSHPRPDPFRSSPVPAATRPTPLRSRTTARRQFRPFPARAPFANVRQLAAHRLGAKPIAFVTAWAATISCGDFRHRRTTSNLMDDYLFSRRRIPNGHPHPTTSGNSVTCLDRLCNLPLPPRTPNAGLATLFACATLIRPLHRHNQATRQYTTPRHVCLPAQAPERLHRPPTRVSRQPPHRARIAGCGHGAPTRFQLRQRARRRVHRRDVPGRGHSRDERHRCPALARWVVDGPCAKNCGKLPERPVALVLPPA